MANFGSPLSYWMQIKRRKIKVREIEVRKIEIRKIEIRKIRKIRKGLPKNLKPIRKIRHQKSRMFAQQISVQK